MNPNQCTANVYAHGRWPRPHQCRIKSNLVERGGKLYCKHHDPQAVAEKHKQADDALRAERDRQNAIIKRATELAETLGVSGQASYNAFARPTGRYVEALVISFEDVERLIEKLKTKGDAEP